MGRSAVSIGLIVGLHKSLMPGDLAFLNTEHVIGDFATLGSLPAMEGTNRAETL